MNENNKDAARLELKSRTNLLDDSKRGAEGAKKDAEKNVKVVQEKILTLLLEDRDFIFCYQKQSLEPSISDTLEKKKSGYMGFSCDFESAVKETKR